MIKVEGSPSGLENLSLSNLLVLSKILLLLCLLDDVRGIQQIDLDLLDKTNVLVL